MASLGVDDSTASPRHDGFTSHKKRSY